MNSIARLFSCTSSQENILNRKKEISLKRKNICKHSRENSLCNNNSVPSAPQEDNYSSMQTHGKDSCVASEKPGEDTSFWGVKNYRVALKRYDNGNKLCSELEGMISERGDIENNYARALLVWNSRWRSHLETETVEYGTTRKYGWLAMLDEGVKTAQIHVDAKNSLNGGPIDKIKQYQKQNYQRHIINFKKTKELEDEFEEAQKAWAKLIDKMNKLKKEYYDSIKATHQADETTRESDQNPKISEDQRRKYHAKVDLYKGEQENSKKRYEDLLKELDLYRPIYVENMTKAFEMTQNLEQERQLFFKQIFSECHQILKRVHEDELNDLAFEEFVESINKINSQEDTEWWSRMYGVGTKALWPKFEEYNRF